MIILIFNEIKIMVEECDLNLEFQTFKWETEEDNEEVILYCHGLTKNEKSVSVKISDFLIYVYLELDFNINWTKTNLAVLNQYFKGVLGTKMYVKSEYQEKTKNYYYRPAKFLKVYFKCESHVKVLEKKLKNSFVIYGLGTVDIKMHEQKAGAILQFFAVQKIKPSGWVSINLNNATKDIFSSSDYNLTVNYKQIIPISSNNVVNPLVLSYDIECVSEDRTGKTFPVATKPDNVIICIAATLTRYSNKDENTWKKYVFVNAEGDREIESDDYKVFNCKNERDLLLKWSKFIKTRNPDIITSFNGLGFDDNYIKERAGDIHQIWNSFADLGRILGKKCPFLEKKWNSSAYGDQIFKYIDIYGRPHLDMFPIISKEYTNLESYKLNDLSQLFLNDSKVDLPPDEMIRIYHNGITESENRFSKAMKKIADYNIQDTILPIKLMQHLHSFIGLLEMSNTVNVQIFDIITRGQQYRTYSLMYCDVIDRDIVCISRNTDYVPTEYDKKFVGATVQNPKIGLWEDIATFDFASLYPTTIIAYNLCFSTFIPKGVKPTGEFHDLHIPQHSGCIHDHSVRKTKVQKDKIICRDDNFKFYKSEVRKGIIPTIAQNLLDARKKTKNEMKEVEKKMKTISDILSPNSKIDAREHLSSNLKLLQLEYLVLDKRQNGFKVSANSMYGGFGSEFAETCFFPAAAATTGMSRANIQVAIDYILSNFRDAELVYGDTDSCMIKFNDFNGKPPSELFDHCEKLEKNINNIFPKPIHLEFEKIYKKYLLFTKKKYLGYIMDRTGSIMKNGKLNEDKKGIVIKRRDNCKYLQKLYTELTRMIVLENKQKWQVFEVLEKYTQDLLDENVDISLLTIRKSIKDNYKAENLPHLSVAKKMRERGKYVVAGTRVDYIFIKTEDSKCAQYIKAEDPEFYLKNKNELGMELDYIYYLEKQLVNPIDELLSVIYKQDNIMGNLCKLIKKGETNIHRYFNPNLKIK